MKKACLYILAAVTVANLVGACKKKEVTPDLGYGYFPGKRGHYTIYQVDSVFYNNFTFTIDSFSFQLKEVMESEIFDNTGRKTRRIERYIRKTEADPWTIKDVWTANLTNIHAEKTEENVKFVKLAFPVKLATTWNGNLYNTLGEQEYKYENVHQSFSLNGLSFDSTVTVVQMNDSSLVHKKYAIEIFAKNVGLVYKKFVDIKDEDSDIDFSKPFIQRVDVGYDYSYKLLEYGEIP